MGDDGGFNQDWDVELLRHIFYTIMENYSYKTYIWPEINPGLGFRYRTMSESLLYMNPPSEDHEDPTECNSSAHGPTWTPVATCGNRAVFKFPLPLKIKHGDGKCLVWFDDVPRKKLHEGLSMVFPLPCVEA